jgi:hypothetical protein
MKLPWSKKYESNNGNETKNVIDISTGHNPDAPKAFCEISPICDRSKYRHQKHDPWNERLPGFDSDGLLDSIELLPTRAETHEKLYNDIWQIIENYIWPSTALALILFDENNQPHLLTDQNDILPYKVTLDDFDLDNENSLAAYSLKHDIPLFIYNAKSTTGTVQGIFKMEGTPVFHDGKFQDYANFTNEEKDSFDSSLVLRDQELLRDAVLIPLIQNSKKLGLIFVGEEFPVFDNANSPRTHFSMPWFLKIIGVKIILSLNIIDHLIKNDLNNEI